MKLTWVRCNPVSVHNPRTGRARSPSFPRAGLVARTPGRLERRIILIAEEGFELSLKLKHVVERAGFQALSSPSGFVTLSRAKVMQPALILLSANVGPPGTSETARRIKSNPGMRGIPVVVLVPTTDSGAELVRSYPVEACLPVNGSPDKLSRVVRMLAGSPLVPTREGAPTTAGLEGEVEGGELREILQYLFLSRKCGLLNVTSGSVTGQMHIDGGIIEHAEFAGSRGREACFRMCQLDRAHIRFGASHSGSKKTMAEPGIELLLEAARRADSARASARTLALQPGERRPRNDTHERVAAQRLTPTPSEKNRGRMP